MAGRTARPRLEGTAPARGRGGERSGAPQAVAESAARRRKTAGRRAERRRTFARRRAH
jgi:hypothetical protein